MSTELNGIFLCDDLMFTSKVTTTARAVGVTVKTARTVDQVLTMAAAESPTGIILDLHNTTLDVPVFMTTLREKCTTMPRVVAYASHVNAELLQSARDAGCDRVYPRSQFVKSLETGLKEWLS